MTTLPRPLSALFLEDQAKGTWVPVAIIAMDDEEYVAVDERGRTVAGVHFHFSIVDSHIRETVFDARWADGS